MHNEQQETTITELLILSALWMLFAFFLWYMVSPFSNQPIIVLSEWILSGILGEHLHQIVAFPEVMYLIQVETTIPFRFSDGETAALGMLVNPLTYGYGLPLLVGLTLAADSGWGRKILLFLIGYLLITLVQVWGVVWEVLKEMWFKYGGEAQQVVDQTGISELLIAVCYQLGALILPVLIPVVIWVAGHREYVQKLARWRV